MRKQPQKGRCTKLKLNKCASVCALYDKVQLAYARYLDVSPDVVSFEVNILLAVSVDDLGLSSENYTSDFLLTLADGTQAVREAVYRQHLSRPSTAALLDISKRYWTGRGVTDWGIIIDSERPVNESV